MATDAEKILLQTLGAIPSMYQTAYQTNPEVPGLYSPEKELEAQYRKLQLQQMQEEVDRSKAGREAYQSGGLEKMRDAHLMAGDLIGATRINNMIRMSQEDAKPQYLDGGRFVVQGSEFKENPAWKPRPSAGKAGKLVWIEKPSPNPGGPTQRQQVERDSIEYVRRLDQGWKETGHPTVQGEKMKSSLNAVSDMLNKMTQSPNAAALPKLIPGR